MAAAMRRLFPGVVRPMRLLSQGRAVVLPLRVPLVSCNFSTLTSSPGLQRLSAARPILWTNMDTRPSQLGLLQSVMHLSPSLLPQPVRNLTYFSLKKGKRKTVKSVVRRFLRLHCGLWLRRKAGYKKKLWKKKSVRKKRLREHVFCNGTQSKLLDKMTTSFWKRRNWYMNDPYQKYQDRTNLKL
ncbi:39S ribosomal protein L35, mitochondrial [Arapaima gigas]